MINVFKKPLPIALGEDAGKTVYYAAFSRKGTANSIDIATQMKEGSSAFTRGEIIGITMDLPARIKEAMLAGQAVHILGLGTFKPSLATAVQPTKEQLRTSHIHIKGINFQPESELIADLNAKAKFEWIEAAKADAEDSANPDAPIDTNSTPSAPVPEGSPEGGTTGNTDSTPAPDPNGGVVEGGTVVF